MSRKLEDKTQTWRKYFQKTDKELLSKIHEEVLKLNNRKTNNMIKK